MSCASAAVLAEQLPGVPVTLVASAQPVAARIPPRLVDLHRRVAQAADEPLSRARSTSRLRESGLRRRVVRRSPRRAASPMSSERRRAADPCRSTPAPPWRRSPVASTRWPMRGATPPIVADTGGTSYDVSLVRRGAHPADPRNLDRRPSTSGHMTGFPSVDVKSIGAGGGSIACGRRRRLAACRPAERRRRCPARSATGAAASQPTVTDAALVLGYLDPEFFLGGAMKLDRRRRARGDRRASRRPARPVARRGGRWPSSSSRPRHMVQAIEEITVNQGIDPRDAALVGGGGAAGLNAVADRAPPGMPHRPVPRVGAALSAAGALHVRSAPRVRPHRVHAQ